MQLAITPDQAGALMSRLPEQARDPLSGFLYAEGVLNVPEDFETAVTAVMAQAGWDHGILVPEKRQFTFLEFMELFTAEEQAAIVDSSAVKVKLFLLMAAGASFIDLDDPRTGPGIEALVDEDLISAERKASVMQGKSPGAAGGPQGSYPEFGSDFFGPAPGGALMTAEDPQDGSVDLELG